MQNGLNVITFHTEPLGLFMNDSFTGADGEALSVHLGETGAAWSASDTFSNNTVVINSNRARGGTGTFAVWRSSAVPTSANYTVSCILRYFDALASSVGVVGRCDHSGGNHYLALYSNGASANVWILYKAVNGSFIELGRSGVEPLSTGVDYTLTLDMQGSTIRLLADGVQKVSVTDTSITRSGTAGVWFNVTATASTGIHMASASADAGGVAPNNNRNFACIVDGDSLSGDYGFLNSKTLSQFLSDAAHWNTGAMWNYSVAGQTITQATTDGVTQIDPVFAAMSGYGKKLCCFLCGINDIFAGESAATVLSRLQTYHSARRTAGYKTITFTLPKAASVTGTPETNRISLNSSIRSDPSFADYFVDLDADLRFNDTSNLLYYLADGVHFTEIARQAIADLVVTAVGN